MKDIEKMIWAAKFAESTATPERAALSAARKVVAFRQLLRQEYNLDNEAKQILQELEEAELEKAETSE